MDKKKRQFRDAPHLNSIMRAWLLVIPIIVGVIGSGTTIALWLAVRGESTVSHQVSSLDKDLLNSIRINFRRTYLQYLRARINPGTSPEQIEKLDQRLNELAQEEGKIISKYDPGYVSTQSSALRTLSEILVQLPGPIVYTLCLVVGASLFAMTRSIASFIISRRYSLDPGSDYIREI